MIALGFLAGLWTASRRSLLAGVSAERILDLGLWLMVGSMIGARALYVATFWQEQYAADPFPEVFMIHHGGMVYYGGLIGACLACIIYARVKDLPLWKVADIMAPSIPLGNVFGRLGCVFNGCCYGTACSLPWAITYPASTPNAPHYPVHPTQIYDSLYNLVLYAALAWLFRRRKFDGQVFAVFLLGYAVSRSLVELLRGDYPAYQQFLGGWATPAHIVSSLIFIAGIALLFVLPRLQKRPQP